ncbi:DUF397 domain-containing protein [Spirillospora sp. CA-255316]
MGEAPRAVWRRSSHSTSGENCVEVAILTSRIGVRDSKDPRGPKLIFEAATWHRFAQQVKVGEHDRAGCR